MENLYFLGCLGIFAVLGLLYRLVSSRRPLSLPPGPAGHWLWGNLTEINTPHRAVKAGTDYKKIYGDVVCLRTISNTTIVLNSESAVMELLDKRASETADRPRNVFVRELSTDQNGIAYKRCITPTQQPTSSASQMPRHRLAAISSSDLLSSALEQPTFVLTSSRENSGGFFTPHR
ncbi:hypothetical protein FRC12_000066 [Ceratobasidium sp. 428]|nr:hypothetical protein FRC12_000066 [Ceratobasidium sp. 428]